MKRAIIGGVISGAVIGYLGNLVSAPPLLEVLLLVVSGLLWGLLGKAS